MEWIFALIIIFCLLDIEEKIKKLFAKIDKNDNETNFNKNTKIVLEEYINKDVCIILKDDTEISDGYLFFVGQKNTGKIIDFDNKWVVFSLQKKKEKILYYIKISDIESIDVIS